MSIVCHLSAFQAPLLKERLSSALLEGSCQHS